MDTKTLDEVERLAKAATPLLGRIHAGADEGQPAALSLDESLIIAHYRGAMDPTTTLALVGEVRRLREALNQIASWSEGPEVNSGFDEPNSAAIARAALVSP